MHRMVDGYMEKSETLHILRTLASGIDPQTGVEIPLNSPYRHIKTTRALLTAVKELEGQQKSYTHEELFPPQAHQRREKIKPQMAGSSWSTLEDQELREEYHKGWSIATLAKIHQRTQGAISSRLLRLGIGIFGITDNALAVSAGLTIEEAEHRDACYAHAYVPDALASLDSPPC
jgi:hypothetical protein